MLRTSAKPFQKMQKSAIITGAGSGIGRALAIKLAAKYVLTLLDLDLAGLSATAVSIRSSCPCANIHIQELDVTNSQVQDAAFKAHVQRFGALDLAILNAGIGERGDLLNPETPQDGGHGWQATLDVDLTAVITGARSAAALMIPSGSGTIICIASAAAFFPMPAAPVYAASKAGVVHFTRSIAIPLKKVGIKACAVCPEFVDTPLVHNVAALSAEAARAMMGRDIDTVTLLSVDQVVTATMSLLHPGTKAGSVLLIRQDGSIHYPYSKSEEGVGVKNPADSLVSVQILPSKRASYAHWAQKNWPVSYQKIQVHRLSSNFREATSLVTVPLPPLSTSPPTGMLLLKRVAVGINASDINYTSGRYHGSKKAAEAKLPYDSGFESVAVVAAVATGVQGFAVGDAVVTMTYDGFAEWALTPAKVALKVPRASADMVPLLTSGLTASIALEEAGHLKPGETVLVTAAAGGTGQFAVQLAKMAGCHVVATCGGGEKMAMLKRLGADRVVDYKLEKLDEVLRKEYLKGIDVVYEGVGGDMFQAALENLADRGRLLVIGMIGTYAEGWPPSNYPGMCERLLWKSAAVIGFFLLRYAQHFKSHLSKLVQLMDSGKLQVEIDPRKFVGVATVPEAVEWLHSSKSVGKVVVQLSQDVPPEAPAKL
ncbi:hypothetical protein CEUSTIGMA_g10616.t1 [Chlamydomonas eustigma]|uniref:Enoyl reductase (ER) domain-containing protein n=1 Tax=Chlamydomonas eustigma TaxID=1157962 RepID=A0A250XK59_9CHLO|nr:hypothetical protein CEUSTIGMA_g10616.t1 [Chlamydomonas eustigma]|eukprot:GAX83190.1 hypothetical protein CEUSTIGMA_g10616.t1 [Chlamydomonas eustigma]